MSNLTIVITSCYKYKHIWDIYFKLFRKYWPDCIYEIYFITDIGKIDRINTINIGNDLGWSSNLKKGLELISYKYILLLLEDHLFCNYINPIEIKKSLEIINNYDLGLIRLVPYHNQTKFGLEKWLKPKYGIINKDDNYSISIQPSIWEKDTLLDLLLDGESAWDMEIKGSKRCKNDTSKTFISLHKNEISIFPYVKGLVRGKYTKECIEFLKKENLYKDISNEISYTPV